MEKNIFLYCLDNEEICQTGVIVWNENEFLIDNLIYLTSEKSWEKHMKKAYQGEHNFEYIRKLYEEPSEYVWQGDSIGLRDFNNGLIIHKKGKKETIRNQEESVYKRNIWCFGDSRVSGMLNECKCTFASYLQKIIDDGSETDKVINCGIPGRDIERMVYQIKVEKISYGDVVILATGFYEYDGNAKINVRVWSEYIKEAAQISKQKGATFYYINLPTLLEMSSLSVIEKDMLRVFNTTEFREYSVERIEYYKQFIKYLCSINKIVYYDFAEAFEKRSKYGHVFINMHHYGPLRNRLIADEIYKILVLEKEINEIIEVDIEKVKQEKDLLFYKKIEKMKTEEWELQNYLTTVKEMVGSKELLGEKIGCIIMNANPFTYGHLYLVKQALKEVNNLIVFVVSEDVSYFSFADRYEMVCKNLEKLDNVYVVPSGKFCISSFTFPEYFKKADLQDRTVAVEKDLCLFGEKIAPELNIKIRFVGEEPEDAVTRQYNNKMKKRLPNYGIDVVEIPRKKVENNVIISASKVRKYFSEGNKEKIRGLVPEQTYIYLENMCEIQKMNK